MEEIYFRKIMATVILATLVVLSFLLIKPILLSIIFGILLAFIFTPVYNWFYNTTKSKNISAFLICFLLILLIVLPLWFLTPVIIDQSVKIYISSQQMDFVKPLKSIFPALFASEEFSVEIGSIIHSFVTKITNKLMNSLSALILNFPTIFLQSLVVFFTLFFVLRDKEELTSYIKSLLPFTQDVEIKLFKLSKNITSSVIYGQIVIGIAQGLLLGLGLFIFKVPNALILTLLACLVGIFPIIGVAIIWVPVAIYLLIAGNTLPALGVIIFGLVSSSIDNFLRPIIVSKKTKMPSSLILIGMIGGFFLFGILGLILGPLILAYLLIILEVYRNKKIPSILTK
ncbi:AI-2E family transporter [Candidatus Pacearchaeota archaeon]|nr:AI-2E family transporter [Candidatus Pacearchaeota archaeon]